jgi:uncharacterized protein
MNFIRSLSTELSISEDALKDTIHLLDKGNTIPFIARYRKESTGGLDEVKLEIIQEAIATHKRFSERLKSICDALKDRNQFSPEIQRQLEQATRITELEDIYLPYKPKRRTRGTIAKENGLEPLAKILMNQEERKPQQAAARFVKGTINTQEEALQGARDIVAEWINENPRTRLFLRTQFERTALFQSKLIKNKAEEGANFKDYFSFEEPLIKMPSHRFMAAMRGHKAGILTISCVPNEEKALLKLEQLYCKVSHSGSDQLKLAIKESYKRLICPSLENEVLSQKTEQAEKAAVVIFSENLRQLLMTSPLGEKRVLALDPGFKSGCKLVCLDKDGQLLHNETIYPHPPQGQDKQAMAKISQLIEIYKIEAFAIGNGTAGRETEQLIGRMRFNRDIQVYVVNESGASVYSASKIAREEFPEFDVTVRGAVSIGRRLQDPLAELVKIDPKSIGIGQYQHDIDQNLLAERLTNVVVNCVNQVGVNINTASKHLLAYVSGLGPSLAATIVNYRSENGPFKKRAELLKVPRLGEKVYEQCAGFLRIQGGDQPLDNSAVHPERYELVEQIASKNGLKLSELIGNAGKIKQLNLAEFVSGSVGLPTLLDIAKELEKPGLDPRKSAGIFEFDKHIKTVSDLIPGMELPGIITNITAFGAFVDVGVKQDGLVHISQLADKFVSDPMEVVRLNQHVKVKVLEVDLVRKRIAFSMKGLNE